MYGSKLNLRKPQVSIYQGSIWGTHFDPLPFDSGSHETEVLNEVLFFASPDETFFHTLAGASLEVAQGSLKDTCCPFETWCFPPK